MSEPATPDQRCGCSYETRLHIETGRDRSQQKTGTALQIRLPYAGPGAAQSNGCNNGCAERRMLHGDLSMFTRNRLSVAAALAAISLPLAARAQDVHIRVSPGVK